jgi:hypothetical protein
MMTMPNPDMIDATTLAAEMKAMARQVMKVDGNRDRMIQSRLICATTQDASHLLLIAAAKLESMK